MCEGYLVAQLLVVMYLEFKILVGERKAAVEMSTYVLHDGERVTIVEHAPELLAVDAEWAPTSMKPPVHLHPEQDERFEIRSGELSVHMDGATHVVRAGESLEVPRGTVHKMWNAGTVPVEGRWEVRPALRTAEFFADVHESRAYRRNRHGALTLLGSGPILREYDDVFRLPLPRAIARPVAALLAGLARLRGYPRNAESRRPLAAGSHA
jgi:mannose-6-phosphate isomerase-like protein (cupin superfamily)